MAYIGNTSLTTNVQPATDFFSGNGSTMSFTLSRTVISTFTIEAVINNVQQNPSTAYTVSGNTITFTSAPPSGTNNIYVNYNSIQGQVVGIGQGTVGPTQLTTGAPSWDSNGNLTAGGTGALTIPTGTTAQRPSPPTDGMIRKNTTTGYVEFWNPVSSSWTAIGEFSALGGTLTTSGGYQIHTFTASGTFTVTAGSRSVEYLIVAGGGGGGSEHGGGGGGGGFLTGNTFLGVGTYSIVVGAGGTGAPYSATNGAYTIGTNGANSSALNLTAIGGGYGASYRNGATSQGNSGGSGGGGGAYDGGGPSAGGAGTAGQGFAGGRGTVNSSPYTAGGGGGANAVGGDSTGSAGGNGGAGKVSSITGSSVTYAGGGGGAGPYGTATFSLGGAGGGGNSGSSASFGGVFGTANTGGGGGGSYDNAGASAVGGNGGSGIVIIRYLL